MLSGVIYPDRFVRGFVLFTTLLLSVGCGGGTKTVAPPMPDMKVLLQSATLGPGDVVEIRVYQEKELSGLYRVGPSGDFEFPLIGAVNATSRTPSQLVQQLTNRLKNDYLVNPQVSVFVKEFNSKKIFVLGQVRKPGTFRYESEMTIVQAVTLAGGLKALASRNRIILTRVEQGDEKKYVIPFSQISEGVVKNVFLQPGDIIYAPESWL
ncbi:MAG: polysaccharide biosynthesis/export family protein [Bradymonadia bacterium]